MVDKAQHPIPTPAAPAPSTGIGKKPFYKKWWGILLIILLLPYFAIWWVWVKSRWGTGAKIGSTVGIVIFALIGLTLPGGSSEITPNATPPNTNQSTNNPQPIKKQVTYEVVKQWDIPPDGGIGKLILISLDYLNDDDMKSLCEKLKSDHINNGDRVIVSGYTDKNALNLRDKVIAGTASKKEEALYDTHFVIVYTRNSNTGNHNCNYAIKGGLVDGEVKTIKY